VAVFLVIFGLIFEASPLIAVVAAIAKGENLIFVLFAVPFLIGGIIPLAIGVLALFGHTEVEVSENRISVLETAGPVRWGRSRTANGLEKFQVLGPGPTGESHPALSGKTPDLAAIAAIFGPGKRMLVAPGYPTQWLVALANELAAKLLAAAPGTAAAAKAPEVEVIDSLDSEPRLKDRFEQPENSRALLEHHRNGLTISFPASGLWKGGKGLFGFALLWCGFIGVFTGIFLSTGGAREWPVLAFLGVFWLIGVAMLLGAINIGRRQAVLAVLDGDLAIIQKGIFGATRVRMAGNEVAAVRAGPSGASVNDRPILELQVLPVAGTKVGLLAGRDDRELEWAATVLRQALQVPGTTPATGESSGTIADAQWREQ
jgi:hypothetical protein